MIALDTNALLRVILGDPPEQTEAVRALMERERIYLPLTVILETEWALRSVYRYRRPEVVMALRSVIDLPQVTVEQSSRVELAMDWTEEGVEFADGLHLASSDRCEALATFDRPFARKAPRLAAVPVQLLG